MTAANSHKKMDRIRLISDSVLFYESEDLLLSLLSLNVL